MESSQHVTLVAVVTGSSSHRCAAELSTADRRKSPPNHFDGAVHEHEAASASPPTWAATTCRIGSVLIARRHQGPASPAGGAA
jgi:hypothetical protein